MKTTLPYDYSPPKRLGRVLRTCRGLLIGARWDGAHVVQQDVEIMLLRRRNEELMRVCRKLAAYAGALAVIIAITNLWLPSELRAIDIIAEDAKMAPIDAMLCERKNHDTHPVTIQKDAGRNGKKAAPACSERAA